MAELTPVLSAYSATVHDVNKQILKCVMMTPHDGTKLQMEATVQDGMVTVNRLLDAKNTDRFCELGDTLSPTLLPLSEGKLDEK